ncbi:MAG TPA: IclR family transcriptional regulator [Opitutaceae bacterium]|nr:IclR family transcriptional regulator [Opitutaceae bacterium]
MAKTPNYPVPALEKGLDILETVAAAAVPQSLAELATQLERSSSELFRMLNCLERRRYVTRDPSSGKYALTLKLYTLAHAHSVTEKLLQAARAPMQELTETCRESCHLSVFAGSELVVVAQEESPERVRLSIEVGAVFDPACTASGRLLLAFANDADRGAIMAESSVGRQLSGRPLEEFEATLAEVRRRGISTAESETIEGVRDVSVLVGNPAAGVTAALAITRLLKRGFRGDEANLIRAMRKAADEITTTLGIPVLTP